MPFSTSFPIFETLSRRVLSIRSSVCRQYSVRRRMVWPNPDNQATMRATRTSWVVGIANLAVVLGE